MSLGQWLEGATVTVRLAWRATSPGEELGLQPTACARPRCRERCRRGCPGRVGEQGDVRVSPAGKETREAGEGAEDECRDLPYAPLCCSVLWLLPEPHAVGGVLLSPRATHIWRRADQNRLAAHYHPVTAYLPCKFQKPNKSCIRWPPESNFIYCL